MVPRDGWERFLEPEIDYRKRADRGTIQGKVSKEKNNDIRRYFTQTSANPRCPIGSNDVYYADSRDNKIGQFCAIFVNVRNAAVTSTVISPKPGNAMISNTTPEFHGGFTKMRTDSGTNLAVNFTVLPYGRDIMNNHVCIWIARKLQKLSGFCWDPRNDLSQQHSGGRSCTLLIATVNQSNPKHQYRIDVSLRNKDVYRDNPRIVDIMLTPKRGIGIYLEITPLERREYDNHIQNWIGNTWYVNNIPLWQTRNNTSLRHITMTKYVNDDVTEQLVSNTFFSVDPDVYRHLRTVYNFPEASEDTKEEKKGRPTP